MNTGVTLEEMVDYSRFDLSRPEFLADDHWRCIEREVERLQRSLEADDGSQALADCKCLVESIARVVYDIEGTPAAPTTSFDTLVSHAHSLLAGQPGDGLAKQQPFARAASQASKIARNLGDIRNQFGGGHGRARTPDLSDEMVLLALDGGLLWARWALRRLGHFSEGRPLPLINDLIVTSGIFRSGTLKRRLLAANLPALEPRHQRSIGVAVGQRVMRETFVVRQDGLNPCLDSDDLSNWPAAYRIGLAYGLWFDPDDRITLTPQSIQDALVVLEPIPDCANDLLEWVQRIAESRVPGGVSNDWNTSYATAQFVRRRIPHRPTTEQASLATLADNIEPEPPF